MQNYREIITWVIMVLVAFLGAPITQIFKNLLSAIFKKIVEEKWALLLSAFVACGVALLEMWLSGQLAGWTLTPENFPSYFTAVFTVSQIYYNLFKSSSNILGTKALLKPPSE